MIVVLQRVSSGQVSVDGEVVGRVGRGLVLLCGAVQGDADEDVVWLADKVVDLRVFEDGEGRTNLAVGEVDGAALVVPQFTLAADWRKGRRPSFVRAAAPDEARRLVGVFSARLGQRGLAVESGRFGAMMAVSLVNDGPFTLVLDSDARPGAVRRPRTPTPSADPER